MITRPDDWHLHLRDGAGLKSVVPHTAKHYGRAIIMPNLVPPVTSAAQVRVCDKALHWGFSGDRGPYEQDQLTENIETRPATVSRHVSPGASQHINHVAKPTLLLQ